MFGVSPSAPSANETDCAAAFVVIRLGPRDAPLWRRPGVGYTHTHIQGECLARSLGLSLSRSTASFFVRSGRAIWLRVAAALFCQAADRLLDKSERVALATLFFFSLIYRFADDGFSLVAVPISVLGFSVCSSYRFTCRRFGKQREIEVAERVYCALLSPPPSSSGLRKILYDDALLFRRLGTAGSTEI